MSNPMKKAEGRRQKAEGFVQKGIHAPNVRGRLNRRLSRGLNPCTRVVARRFGQSEMEFIPSAFCPLPSAFLDKKESEVRIQESEYPMPEVRRFKQGKTLLRELIGIVKMNKYIIPAQAIDLPTSKVFT